MAGNPWEITKPFLLNMQMIADALEDESYDYHLYTETEEPFLRGCSIYCGQKELEENLLYILPDNRTDFPSDSYPYITSSKIEGAAPHIDQLQLSFEAILNLAISLFRFYSQMELELNYILTNNGNLNDLCRLASIYLNNPVYIHDDRFTVIGLSGYVEGMLKFEKSEVTGNLYIPLSLIDDFKFDESYRKTMELQQPGIWDTDQYPHNIRSLFANLRDGKYYYGRILVNELRSLLRPSQKWVIEYFARYAIRLLHNQNTNRNVYQTFDATLISLMNGENVNHRELKTMLNILDWHESDRYICMKFESQNPKNPIRSDSALNNKLYTELGGFSSFYSDNRLCIVMNISEKSKPIDQIRQILAPYVRDSYMYVGISNPVDRIFDVCYAFHQTDIVLDYINQKDNSQWVRSFSECALYHIQTQITREIPAKVLAAPALMTLRRFDTENNTQYYDTLHAYLLCERSIPQTSEMLYIHRTTLTYRLGKIQELIHVNLDSPSVRQYLQISYFIMENAG